ncbi:MAG: ACT domain-containing protein [Clostridia bacterium]|nr:ACT domain-containing protein [Clostridia bacterium]MBQ3255952.1 ACT domain-containing protein [Oscillospiraceae bacterium]
MKAVITVTGTDSKGIIAKVSGACFEHGANIIDISQSVLKEYFAMIMLVDIDDLNIGFNAFIDSMTELGNKNGLQIHTMHEDIFNTMHKI